jgi:hypothetical protein
VKSDKKKRIQKKKSAPRRQPSSRVEDLDDNAPWEVLFAAFHETTELALDVAARFARGFPDDTDAVERVRAFLRARLVGHEASISVDDVLRTFGLLIVALGRDLESIAQATVPFIQSLRFPSATEFQPRIPRRFHHPHS